MAESPDVLPRDSCNEELLANSARRLQPGSDLLVTICSQPTQQVFFEIGVGSRRGGVIGVPYGEGFRRQRFIVVLDDRVFKAQPELIVDKCEEGRSSDSVVVVRKLLAAVQSNLVFSVIEFIKLLQFWETLGGKFDCPVIGGIHPLGFWSEAGSKLDVAGANS